MSNLLGKSWSRNIIQQRLSEIRQNVYPLKNQIIDEILYYKSWPLYYIEIAYILQYWHISVTMFLQ